MAATEIAAHLLNTCDSLKYFESYMFGSSLFGLGGDIDILVVGPTGRHLSRLKREIATAGRELPLDVLYMDPSEACETGFILNEKCVALTSLAGSSAGGMPCTNDECA